MLPSSSTHARFDSLEPAVQPPALITDLGEDRRLRRADPAPDLVAQLVDAPVARVRIGGRP
jgi:hypothetical protein